MLPTNRGVVQVIGCSPFFCPNPGTFAKITSSVAMRLAFDYLLKIHTAF